MVGPWFIKTTILYKSEFSRIKDRAPLKVVCYKLAKANPTEAEKANPSTYVKDKEVTASVVDDLFKNCGIPPA